METEHVVRVISIVSESKMNDSGFLQLSSYLSISSYRLICSVVETYENIHYLRKKVGIMQEEFGR